jgi:deazaflavin-dependent oxidoreductase (nitroreductase family)
MCIFVRGVSAAFAVTLAAVVLIRIVLGCDGLRVGNAVRRFNKFILNPFALWLVAHRRMYYAVLHHVGRRSGRVYATPVVARRVHEGVIIPMTYGAGADWCRNVLAAGGCTLTSSGKTYSLAAPRILTASSAEPLVPPLLAWACRLAGIKSYLSCRIADPQRAGDDAWRRAGNSAEPGGRLIRTWVVADSNDLP